ncbi:MAG: hypothetical protein BAJALOKI1v1_570009 [Promethearchaeota archaeon]|nr:MAG: hypothetical protein BAJALOKI1v1_570009 [Candidatus Lokiarchaeota archaeon]
MVPLGKEYHNPRYSLKIELIPSKRVKFIRKSVITITHIAKIITKRYNIKKIARPINSISWVTTPAITGVPFEVVSTEFILNKKKKILIITKNKTPLRARNIIK